MLLRLSLQTNIALAAIMAAIGATLLHSRPSGPVAHLRPLANAPAQAFYAAAAKEEVGERKKGQGKFRGSAWSQDDDFHYAEAQFLRSYSKSHRFTMGSVLDALDRGMREKWPTGDSPPPDQKVPPCRPRLSY